MVKLYVEGGGQTADLQGKCREGFRKFLKKAGLKGKMPRIIASGARLDAYNDYRKALGKGESAALLVDSEGPVSYTHCSGEPADWQPWQHLETRPGDGWEKPDGATDKDCHLMVQCMESWLLADQATLKAYFGQGFNANSLPAGISLGDIPKKDVMDGLKAATRQCKTKDRYNKGRHSFGLLGLINPNEVMKRSPWAERFVEQLKKKMAATP